MKDSFKSVSATQDNPKWKELIKRANPLYLRNNDLRSEFARDYTRILHCNAYRRLKHKYSSLLVVTMYVQEVNM